MAKSQGVWGIDVGQCALKAIRLRQTLEGVEATAIEVIEHPKILSQPEVDPEPIVREALEKLLAKHDMRGDLVVVSVPGQQTFTRFTKLPPVEPKKIPDIVRFEAGQQIPFDMEEVIWDFQTFSSPDSPDVEVGIFAMKRDLVRQHLAHFALAKIEPIIVQAAPLALYNYAKYDGLCGEGATLLLDIGAENTNLLIADGASIWARNIHLGGNNFTQALVKTFKLSFGKAESLKRTAASSKYARQIFQAMRPVFADLVAEIQRSIGFYTSTHREAKLARVVGLGNAFKLPGLQKFLGQNLQLEVGQISEFKGIRLAETLTGEGPAADHILSFPVACGLALQGLGLGGIDSNLLPPEIARQVLWQRKRPWFAAAAACLVLAAGSVWLGYQRDTKALASHAGRYPEPTRITPPFFSPDEATRALRGADLDLPAREYTVRWLGVAQAFRNEYNKLAGLGGGKVDEVRDILTLQDNKFIVSKIVHFIHTCLPALAPRETPTTGPATSTQPAGQPGTLQPRAEREEIYIRSLSIRFVPDVDNPEGRPASDSGVREPMMRQARTEGPPVGNYYGASAAASAFAEKPARKGFLVTIDGQTPHKDKEKFIQRTLIRDLKTKPTDGFYVDVASIDPGKIERLGDVGGTGRGAARQPAGQWSPRAFPGSARTMLPQTPVRRSRSEFSSQRLRRPRVESPDRGRRPRMEEERPFRPSRQPRMPARGGWQRPIRTETPALGAGRPGQAADESMIDPVTREPMDDDRVFTLQFVIVLGDRPEETAEEKGRQPPDAVGPSGQTGNAAPFATAPQGPRR